MTCEQIQEIVDAARAFLVQRLADALSLPRWQQWQEFGPDGILDRHLYSKIEPPTSLDQIMGRLLESAQNRQGAPRVILGAVDGGLNGLRDLLGGFDPERIRARWRSGKEILDHLKSSGRIRGKLRQSKLSLWPKFCETTLSGAEFLSRFGSAREFKNWVSKFQRDPDLEAALPLILAEEIKGFGLALACDFLKELGYAEYGKPDVQVKRLLWETGISSATTDYMVLRDMIRAAHEVRMTPYAFDKVFWLIGSGRFYRVRVKESGEELFIGRQSDEFLDYLRRDAIISNRPVRPSRRHPSAKRRVALRANGPKRSRSR